MFKIFDPARDIKTQVSTVNEVLVFNGVIFTGTAPGGGVSVKKYAHWASGSVTGSLYQSLYSANYASASSVELMNITYGQSISSTLYNNALAVNKVEKNKVYRLHAKMLLGDEDERFLISGSERDNLIFLHFKRSQYKDEIKKGSISIVSMNSGSISNTTNVQSIFSTKTMADTSESSYVETERGDVGSITSGSSILGQVYYQAGVVVLIPELFSNTSSVSTNPGNFWQTTHDYNSLAISGSYELLLDGCRTRFRSMTMINQSNLQSTYYFVRALNDEFNYSSNPTFLDSSQRIIPTSGSNNLQTRTYITKVGLLGENNELLAVASTSSPLKKSPDGELTLKVRLDN